MFRFDTVGTSDVSFAPASLPAPIDSSVHALLNDCTVPIAIHNFHRAAVLGAGTLVHQTVRGQPRPCLITAAHLFDAPGTSVGNLLVAMHTGDSHAALVNLSGARVQCDPHDDVAVIDLTHAQHARQICQHRATLPLDDCLHDTPGSAASAHLLCGYPGAWSRFERGWLAARRLTVRTQPRSGMSAGLYEFATQAQDAQGRWIHTPAMEGMSGAGLWRIEPAGGHTRVLLAGVQSSFVHSRYLRAAPTRALRRLLSTL